MSLVEEVVAERFVGTALANVGRHSYGVQHEVERAAEVLHCLVYEHVEIFYGGRVGRYHHCAALLGKLVNGAQPYGYGRVGQYYVRTLLLGLERGLPGDRLVVQRACDYAFLAFE